jgi:dTDP-glucose 4,6-dehydratase
VQFVKDRPGHDRRYAMDSTRIRRELGWRPRHDLENGLIRTVEWYLEHADWVATINQQEGYHQWLEANYRKRE